MKLTYLSAMVFAILIIGCSEKKDNLSDDKNVNDSSDETITDDDTVDVAADGPKPPDWGECTGGWEQKEQINEKTGRLEARWCEPPENWRPAAPPDWGDCPDGWEQKEDKDEDGNLLAKYCEPILPPEGTECEPGYFAMFGSTECQRIGDPCPEGEFADIPNDAGTEILYVKEGESIQEAIDNAKDGAVIAIGKGTFDEFVTITDKNIALWGACVEGTVLSPTTPMSDETNDAIIRIDGIDSKKTIEVQNMTLTGGQRRGVKITGISGTLKSVEIVNTVRNGVAVEEGGSLLMEASLIKDTLPFSDNSRGQGLVVFDNGIANLNKVVLDNNHYIGIFIATYKNGTSAELNATDVIVKNTQPNGLDDASGDGIDIEENSIVNLNRVLIEGNRTVGMVTSTYESTAKAQINAQNIIIRNTREQKSDKTKGLGLWVAENSNFTITNGLIENNRMYGVLVRTKSFANKTVFKGENLIVRNTLPQLSNKADGAGLEINNNADVEINKISVSNNYKTGIAAATFATETEINLKIQNGNIEGTLPQESDETSGTGMTFQDNVKAEIKNCIIDKNHFLGIYSASFSKENNASLTMNDVSVKNTSSQKSDKLYGNGIHIQDVQTKLSRILSENNRTVGIYAGTTLDDETTFIASDIVVKNTIAQEKDQKYGRGMTFQDNITSTLSNIIVDNNKEGGVFIATSNVFDKAEVVAENIIIRNTKAQESDKNYGNGIAIQNNVEADFKNVLIDKNTEMGVYILMSATVKPVVTFSDTVIQNTATRECLNTAEGCKWAPEAPFGHGLGIYWGAEATLSNVVVEGNQNGIQIRSSKVFAGEACSLSSGENIEEKVCLHILNNETAINAFDLPEDYDINSAFAEGKTWYNKNTTNFSGDEQPIPEPSDPMDAMGGN